MKPVSGKRKGLRFFMCSAGISITSSWIHDFSSLAFSPGRSIEQSEKRKSICIRSGASAMTRITSGRSFHPTAGIDVTVGGAKTLETLASGLCSM